MKTKKKFTRYKEVSPLKGGQVPSNIAFWDTETYTVKGDDNKHYMYLKLGVIHTVSLDKTLREQRFNEYVFYTPEAFLSILERIARPKTKWYIFAHNTGFDLRVINLFKLASTKGYYSQPPIINDRVFIWKLKINGGTIQFLDTANYGVSTVQSLGDILGYEKLSVDFDNVSDADLLTYCKRDVEILRRFMIDYIKFVHDNELGGFKLTIASQSIAAYRANMIDRTIKLHDIRVIHRLERDGYYGGRTECFYIGEKSGEPFYYVDVNSMYPYVMKNCPLPYELTEHYKKTTPKFIAQRIKENYVIARVKLKTELNAYPFRYNNRLVFPVGEYTTVLHKPELEIAIKNDDLIEVYETAIYHEDILFGDYVDYFYRLKVKYTEDNNKVYRYITKLLMNSLYGKFGQLKPHREKYGATNIEGIMRVLHYNKVKDQRYQIIHWYGTQWKEYREGETSLSFPAIAGSVTSHARMVLYKAFTLAGKENVFYCDTDSMIVNQIGYENISSIMDNLKLGYWSLDDSSEEIIIHGNKDYVFGDTVKLKGVPSNHNKIDNNTFQYTHWEGFLTWLNSGATKPTYTETRIKRRLGIYGKGKTNPDGSITPYRFPMVLEK